MDQEPTAADIMRNAAVVMKEDAKVGRIANVDVARALYGLLEATARVVDQYGETATDDPTCWYVEELRVAQAILKVARR